VQPTSQTISNVSRDQVTMAASLTTVLHVYSDAWAFEGQTISYSLEPCYTDEERGPPAYGVCSEKVLTKILGRCWYFQTSAYLSIVHAVFNIAVR
jgi:hypothetical protein